ncbi:peptidase G2 autoproteolytic cleavage domain-containing protein [Bacillus cytotoxicus]|uniref:peptidase G2 autoproteolytic cleavage domain-containing protein n=1 Tax=unclassified Bacillus cereus group TaxID=2750818 RepID=UPI001F583EA4|nr:MULTISPECIES: peptidase G2 autoproteolytic cleavage domain-containing protein [unclassified Bacillus cereus group]EMA6345028.1 peptidase G2 [Bacillus cytotoxicus]
MKKKSSRQKQSFFPMYHPNYGMNNWCSIRAAALEVLEGNQTEEENDTTLDPIIQHIANRKAEKFQRKKERLSKNNSSHNYVQCTNRKEKRRKPPKLPQPENLEYITNQVKKIKNLLKPTPALSAEKQDSEKKAATQKYAHEEGRHTKADGIASHAEGLLTHASNAFAHAEGSKTKATGHSSHSEGSETTASGNYAHAEGKYTIALGDAAHAEGTATIAAGFSSHAEGLYTSTAHFAGAHIMGKFGSAEQPYSWFIANGTHHSMPGLGAKWLAHNGEMYIEGASYNASGTDYAQMFETANQKTIDVGYFVTFDTEEKIRKANSADSFILGISSATPLIIGNSAPLSWHNRYVTDEWGQRKYIGEEKEPMIHAEWNPSIKYTPRRERPEWVPVGLMGQILVRDDGTCQTHGYCRPNDNGIATASTSGYFVMKRTGPNQILILFR